MAPRGSLALLCALVVVAAGCGGGSDKSSSSSAPGSTSTPSGTTVTEPPNNKPDHFTQAQYSKYTTDAAKFKAQNEAALTKVTACGNPSQTVPIDKCVGDALTKLYDASVVLGRDLAADVGTVSGDCESSLNALLGYVVPYQASVKSLQSLVDAGNVTTVNASVDNLQSVRQSGQEKASAVATDCKP